MPVEFPDPNAPIRNAIALKQLQMSMQDQKSRAQERLFQIAQTPGIDVTKFFPMAQQYGLGYDVLEAAKEIQKKANALEKQRTMQADNPTAAALAQLGAYAKPGTPQSQQYQQGVQQYGATFDNPALREAALQGLATQTAGVRAGETILRQRAAQQARLQESIGISGDLVESMAFGIASNQVPEDDAVISQMLIEAGMPAAEAISRAPEARVRALKQRQLLRGPMGASEQQMNLEASQQILIDQTRDTDGWLLFSSGNYRKWNKNDAQNISRRLMDVVQSTSGQPVAIVSSNPAQTKVLADKFRAASHLDLIIDDSLQLYAKVEQKMRPGPNGEAPAIQSVGPFRPAFFQDILRAGGAQDPDLAQFMQRALLVPATMLKVAQGSRPSDFDFKNYISLWPKTTEYGTPSARARIEGLRDFINLEQMAMVSPSIRARIRKSVMESRRRAEASMTPEQRQADQAAQAAWDNYKSLFTRDAGGNTILKPGYTNSDVTQRSSEFMDAAQKWSETGMNQYYDVRQDLSDLMPSSGAPRPSSPAGPNINSLVNRAMGAP